MTTLNINDLESVLREVAQLSGVKITQPFPIIASNMIHIAGAINVHGTTYFWETDVDLRDLKTREDIAVLIESLLTSFAKAERGEVIG